MPGEVVVIDAGSSFTRAGVVSSGSVEYSQTHIPDIEIETATYRTRSYPTETPDYHANLELAQILTLKKAACRKSASARKRLTLLEPIMEGVIYDYQSFGCIVKEVLETLETEECAPSILFSEVNGNSLSSKRKLFEEAFEEYGASEVNVQPGGVLGLWGSGRVSGVVVDCGGGKTNVMSICQGHIVWDAARTLPVGGISLDRFMCLLLSQQGNFTRTDQRNEISEIKEKYCNLLSSGGDDSPRSIFNFFHKKENVNVRKAPTIPKIGVENITTKNNEGFNTTVEHQMEDGKIVLIDRRVRSLPKALFYPAEVLGVEGDGLHQMVYSSILSCPIDHRSSLFKSIVCIGGSCGFPGFREHLENAVTDLVVKKHSGIPPKVSVRLEGDPIKTKTSKFSSKEDQYENGDLLSKGKKKKENKMIALTQHVVYRGGAALASMKDTFKDGWITSSEYEENGDSIITGYI